MAASNREKDQLIVDRIQRGEVEAFNLLVIKYRTRLCKLISRVLRSSDDSEDIVQEAFIRALKALPKFRGESAFYSWMYRITVNTAKNHLLTNKRVTMVTLDSDDFDVEDFDVDRPNELRDPATPEDVLSAKQMVEQVGIAMEGMQEELRIALWLREIEGLSYDEIAERMNSPVGTVRSRLFRGRDAVAAAIAPTLEPSTNRRRW